MQLFGQIVLDKSILRSSFAVHVFKHKQAILQDIYHLTLSKGNSDCFLKKRCRWNLLKLSFKTQEMRCNTECTRPQSCGGWSHDAAVCVFRWSSTGSTVCTSPSRRLLGAPTSTRDLCSYGPTCHRAATSSYPRPSTPAWRENSCCASSQTCPPTASRNTEPVLV